ncbi:MAG: dienelactone hydrolase [Pseudomonadota bacterium]
MRAVLAGFTFVFALALSLSAPLWARDGAYQAGLRQITVPSPARGADLNVTLWYPAAPGGARALIGDTVFFSGTEAWRGAPFADGRFPLIMLSHGAGLAGSGEAMSWIATPLAEAGFIVVAPTHPGNTGPDRSAAETMKLWLRSQDISATLDAVTAAPELELHLAEGAIGALGLSMGGSTALMLAGARLDPERLASYCDTDDLNPSLCAWVRLSGVDLRQMDTNAAGGDYRDPRIRFAMAIDPAPVDVLAPQSFGDVTIPVALVNLGTAESIPATVQAAPVAQAMAAATYQTLPEASHNSMFAECKPGAAQLAVDEGIEDPICDDGGGRPRAALHAEIIEMAREAFTTALKPGG